MRFDSGDDHDWIKFLRREGALVFPRARLQDVLRDLTSLAHLPSFVAPHEDWQVERQRPTASVRFQKPDPKARHVVGEIVFDYEGSRSGSTIPAR
ncbi:MAG: hypothetical protein HC923_09750, partial [Myxococcales bacterium]|nr:hypothetical protein [Myxococcales bacterium]